MATVENARELALQATAVRDITAGVSLSINGMAFTKPKNNGTVTPASITITATPTATYSSPTYVWEYALSATPTTWVTTGTNSSSLAITNTAFAGYISTSASVTYRCTVTQSGKPTSVNTIQVLYVKESDEAIVIELNNNSILLNASNTGVVTDFSNTNTVIKVLRGSTYLTNNTSGANTFSVAANPTVSPAAGVTLATPTGTGTTAYNLANITAASSVTDYTTVTYSITVRDASGTAISGFNPATVVQYYFKSLGSNEASPGIDVVSSLPTTGNFEGRVVFRTTDKKLYRYIGAPTNDFVATVNAGDITEGTLPVDRIAAGALDATKFASSLSVPLLVTADPTTGNFVGRLIYRTDLNKLFRWNGSGWTAEVDGADLTANSITGGKIQAGAIAADQIAANAITASKLFIGDTSNVYPDFDMQDEDFYPLSTAAPFSFIDTNYNNYGARRLNIASSADVEYVWSQWFQVEPSTDYRIEVSLNRVDGATGTAIAYWETGSLAAGGVITSLGVSGVVGSNSTTTPNRYGVNMTTGATARRMRIVFERSAGAGGNVTFGGVVIRRRNTGDLIVDGAITTNKMTANSIDGDRIQAGTLDADRITANTITAGQILAGTIGATQLAAQSVTTSKLVVTDSSNMVPDAEMVDDAAWVGNTPVWVAAPAPEWRSVRVARLDGAGNQYFIPITRFIPVNAGEPLFVSYQGQILSGTGSIYLQLNFTESTTDLSPVYDNVGSITTTTLTTLSGIRTVPAGQKYLRVQLVKNWDGVTSAYMGGVIVRRATNAELIVDGTVSAQKINANGLTIRDNNGNIILNANVASAASSTFAGNATGNINGTAASTITTAVSAVNDATTGLARKLGEAEKSVLEGVGGIAVGTIDWDSAGTVNAGTGVAITSKGITARNAGGSTTFTLDATTGNATYAGTVTASQVTAGTFSADRIAANAITASKIAVADLTNLCRNSDFAGGSSDGLILNTAGTVVASTDVSVPANAPSTHVFTRPVPAVSIADFINEDWFPVTPGESFYYEIVAAASAGTNGNLNLSLRIAGKDTAGTNAGVSVGATLLPASYTTWTKYGAVVTIPAEVSAGVPTAYARFYVRSQINASPVGAWFIARQIARRAANSEMIVDGSVTAQKITVTDLSVLGSANTGNLTVNGNLTLNTTGAIRSTGATYGSSGIFLGYDTSGTSAYKFSVGGGTADTRLTFDGTTLTVPAARLSGAVPTTVTGGPSTWQNSNVTMTTAGVFNNGTQTTLALGSIAGTLSVTQFANSLRPVEVLGTFPGSGNFDGRMVFLTTDKKLYRYNATTAQYTKEVDGLDIKANSITAGQIAAGAITASEIAAKAITAAKLVVADLSNLVRDPDFTDSTLWFGTGITLASAAGTAFDSQNYMQMTGTAGVEGPAYPQSQSIPVQAGVSYYIRAQAQVVSGTGDARLFLNWLNAEVDAGQITNNFTIISASTSITEVSFTATPPAGKKLLRIGFYKGVTGTATDVRVGGVVVRKAASGELIVNGAVTANKITVDGSINITSDSGNIRSGQTAYNTGTGFWLGRVSGNGRFSIGNSTTNYMSWDSTNGLKLVGSNIVNGSGTVLLNTSGPSPKPWIEDATSVTGAVSLINNPGSGNSIQLKSLEALSGITLGSTDGKVSISSTSSELMHMVLNSNKTSDTTSPAVISGMDVQLEANTTYALEGVFLINSAGAEGVGPTIGIEVPYNVSTGTMVTGTVSGPSSALVQQSRSIYTTEGGGLAGYFNDHYQGNATWSSTAYALYRLDAVLVTGSTTGPLKILLGSQTAGVVMTMRAGSYYVLRKLTNRSVDVAASLVGSNAGITSQTADATDTDFPVTSSCRLTLNTNGTWNVYKQGSSTASGSWTSPADSASASQYEVMFNVTSGSATTNTAPTYSPMNSNRSIEVLVSSAVGQNLQSSSVTFTIKTKKIATGAIVDLTTSITLTANATSYSSNPAP